MATEEILLQLKNVNIWYDSIHAVFDLSIEVKRGAVVFILGANGAGKTTLLKCISGLVHPATGWISFASRRIERMQAFKIARLGICHVPEGRLIFPDLTVRENLLMGGFTVQDKKVLTQNLSTVFDAFPTLKERMRQSAGTLSGGEQQMLAIGRGLMSKPSLMILDEPSLGLAPKIINEIFDGIKMINQNGATILLAEQNTSKAFSLGQYGYVLKNGRVCLQGPVDVLTNNDYVRKLYLEG